MNPLKFDVAVVQKVSRPSPITGRVLRASGGCGIEKVPAMTRVASPSSEDTALAPRIAAGPNTVARQSSVTAAAAMRP